MLPDPYWSDDAVTLYLGDCRQILPMLKADCIITDPPYGETSLEWDQWPAGWPALASMAARSMWCFGSLRMLMDRAAEFSVWRLSHDVVWQKHNATGPDSDRFRRVHEMVTHWYQGAWKNIYRKPQRITTGVTERGRVVKQGAKTIAHRGNYVTGSWLDDGTRLMTSVIAARSMHRNGGIHPTEKPEAIVTPLIEYAVPQGGIVLDCFAGSGVVLDVSRKTGRRAIGIEINESYCRGIVKRLSQQKLAV